MADVFEWAGLDKSQMGDEATIPGSLAKLMGVKQITPTRVIGIIDETDYDTVLAQWKVPEGGAGRLPTLAELGMGKSVGHAARVVAGRGQTVENLRQQLATAKAAAKAQASPPAPAPATGSPPRKVKLSGITSQVDDAEIALTSEQQLVDMYLEYERVFGKGERPSKDMEPTSEQLSAVMHLLQSGLPPYTDFAVWGPYGHRIERKLKLQGVTIGRDGVIRTVELQGPPNITNWLASFNVLITALVMTKAIDLGILTKYRAHIERLHDRYSQKIWAILYQADVRFRLEFLERVKRECAAEHDQAVKNGSTTPFDPQRPWNYTWQKALSFDSFWREEVVEPSMLLLTKVAGMNDVVDDDAKVVSSTATSSHPRQEPSAPARMTEPDMRAHPRTSSRTGRYHQVQDGRYVVNRTGHRLCSGFNDGTCTEVTGGIWCKHVWDQVHQCSRCLGSHGAHQCPHKEMPVPNFLKQKGKPKGGKGKRKGKGSGRAPYWQKVVSQSGPSLKRSASGPDLAELPPTHVSRGHNSSDVHDSTDTALNLPPSKHGRVGETNREHRRILYLFSGPRRPDDGFEKFCRDRGVTCDCIDIEYDESHNLLDQTFWEQLEQKLDQYDGFLISPPCSTFTAARNPHDGGPKPLRGTTGADRYGCKGLDADDKTKVREGTILALRGRTVACRATTLGRPWILEQPHWRKDKTSMFMLDEFVELAQEPGVSFATIAQCRVGSKFEKLTDLMGNLENMDTLCLKCNHESKLWIVPWSGEKIWAPHPPLKGRQCAVAAEDWHESMLRWYEPAGPYLTRSTAAYPEGFNKLLADKLVDAVYSMEGNAKDGSKPTAQGNIDPVVEVGLQLRQRTALQKEVAEANGLRNVHKWCTDRSLHVGKQVKQVCNCIERWLDQQPEVQSDIIASFGKPKSDVSLDFEKIDQLRSEVFDVLMRNRTEQQSPQCNLDQIDEGDYKTVIRGHLLYYWATAVKDPGADIARWLFEGAPAGLELDTSALDMVCPSVDDDELFGVEELHTDYDAFTNYQGVEDDDEAVNTIEGYYAKGYLAKFTSLDEVSTFLGGEPILSKLGCIKKDKYNTDTGTWTRKSRIILDCKRSNVSKVAMRKHKSVLPRVSDAIQSTLQLMSEKWNDEVVTFMIADVEDAFWLIPLHVRERRYFVARLRGSYYVFLRTAQGSRCAPLTFAAIIGLIARWVQSIVGTPPPQRRTEEARVQVYVDDPLFTLRGTAERVRRLAAVVSLAWMIMGVPMAFHKAVMKPGLTWIGISLTVTETAVEVEVPEAKVVELRGLVQQILSQNVVAKKLLRTCVGKLMAIASVLYVWRPFIQELYVALHETQTQAPSGCVWVKQIRHSLEWMETFLSHEEAGIKRIYTLEHYRGVGSKVVITWDASPYGMGAMLQVDGVITEFFAIPISEDDQRILQTQSGTSEGQQVWESLAGLVALRLWSRYWQGCRAKLQIRSDNVGALTLLATLRGKSKAMSVIAREYALDLGQAQWRPDVATHIPGLTNVICDTLSRRFDPHKKFVLPSLLTAAKAVLPPPRTDTWWKTLHRAKSLKRSPTMSWEDREMGSQHQAKTRKTYRDKWFTDSLMKVKTCTAAITFLGVHWISFDLKCFWFSWLPWFHFTAMNISFRFWWCQCLHVSMSLPAHVTPCLLVVA